MLTDKTTVAPTSEIRHLPWGSDRYTYASTPTTYRFTGQRQESSLWLYFYGDRWYDSVLGRWLSPDSIIPAQQGVMGNDRYAAMNNNPLKYVDPSGHSVDCALGKEGCEAGECVEKESTIADTIVDWLVRDDVTFGFGISGTAGAAISITGSVGFQIDSQGNIGFAISVGGGALLPAAAEVTGFATWTDADNIEQLKGWSMVLGGSLESGGSVGGESIFFNDKSTGEKFKGGTITLGLGGASPIPAEGHIGVNYTWIPITRNLYDIFHLDRP